MNIEPLVDEFIEDVLGANIAESSASDEEIFEQILEAAIGLNALTEAVNTFLFEDADEDLLAGVSVGIAEALAEDLQEEEEIAENMLTRFLGKMFSKGSMGGPQSRKTLTLVPKRRFQTGTPSDRAGVSYRGPSPTSVTPKPTGKGVSPQPENERGLSPDARVLNTPGGWKHLTPDRRSKATGELLNKGLLP